jgi:phage tail-like protein
MAQFAVNVNRFDPYKGFKFHVKWDGRIIAGISRVSALKRTTEVVDHREGSDPNQPRPSPGRTNFEPITLERGVTHDTAFEDWANQVWRLGAPSGGEAALANFRKDIIIELCNEAGQVALSYKVYRCWVSEYQALAELESDGGSVLIQSITLENEGWERDVDVPQPAEPK